MAKMSAAQGVGFVLGPAVGAALGLLGKLNLASYWGPLDYSSVGWLSTVISVLNFALVLFFFVEIPLEHIQPISAGILVCVFCEPLLTCPARTDTVERENQRILLHLDVCYRYLQLCRV
jgi:hypothetical protein